MTNKIIGILLLVATGITGFAQQFTMNDAVSFAREHNPELKQLETALEAKKQEWRLLTGIGSPDFTWFREGIQPEGEPSFSEERLAVSQDFQFPLTVIHRLKALKKEQLALDYKLKAGQRDLKALVKKKYIILLHAIHSVDLLNQQLQLAKQMQEVAAIREQSGVGTEIEMLNAEIKAAELENDLNQAKSRLHEARYGLFRVVGMKPEDQKYSITYLDTLMTHPERIDQDRALYFLEQQPEFLSAAMMSEASDLKLKEAKTTLYPDITLSYYQQDYGAGFDYHGFEVGFKLPLWTPLKYKGMVTKAKFEKQQRQWEQVRVKLQMKEFIENAWHSYENSKAAIERFNKNIRQKAARLQALSLEGYRLGQIDQTSLLMAQQTYLSNQQRYYSSLRDYYIKLVELEKYIGEEIVYQP
jgi:cobalt-zinc-cadmium efflux system outer membrane protein